MNIINQNHQRAIWAAEQVIGMPEQEATECLLSQDLEPRISHRDKEAFCLIDNFVVTRVNLSIDNGKVFAATVG